MYGMGVLGIAWMRDVVSGVPACRSHVIGWGDLYTGTGSWPISNCVVIGWHDRYQRDVRGEPTDGRVRRGTTRTGLGAWCPPARGSANEAAVAPSGLAGSLPDLPDIDWEDFERASELARQGLAQPSQGSSPTLTPSSGTSRGRPTCPNARLALSEAEASDGIVVAVIQLCL